MLLLNYRMIRPVVFGFNNVLVVLIYSNTILSNISTEKQR